MKSIPPVWRLVELRLLASACLVGSTHALLSIALMLGVARTFDLFLDPAGPSRLAATLAVAFFLVFALLVFAARYGSGTICTAFPPTRSPASARAPPCCGSPPT